MASRKRQALEAAGRLFAPADNLSPMGPGYSTAAYTIFHRLLFGKVKRQGLPTARLRKHRGDRS